MDTNKIIERVATVSAYDMLYDGLKALRDTGAEIKNEIRKAYVYIERAEENPANAAADLKEAKKFLDKANTLAHSLH